MSNKCYRVEAEITWKLQKERDETGLCRCTLIKHGCCLGLTFRLRFLSKNMHVSRRVGGNLVALNALLRLDEGKDH